MDVGKPIPFPGFEDPAEKMNFLRSELAHREAVIESRRILATILSNPDWKSFCDQIAKVAGTYVTALKRQRDVTEMYRLQGSILALEALCVGPERAAKELERLQASADELRAELSRMSGVDTPATSG